MDWITCPVGELAAILGGIGIVIDISPIKVKPARWILSKLGNALFVEYDKKLGSIEDDIKDLKNDFISHKVNTWRHDILDFANSCMNGRKHTKEEFDHIFSVHDDYERYLSRNSLENVQVNIAFSFIADEYRKCLENRNFL